MPLLILIVVAFAILKVKGLFALSWLWVFSPVWIPFSILLAVYALFFALFVVVAIFGAILSFASDGSRRRFRKPRFPLSIRRTEDGRSHFGFIKRF